ncbi:DUF202 domain-containing protein [Ramlibacter sp. MAH-25]|uniref:DUF202 domain-containing protein n=2 Tax=Comamonadaceae TaxID=80864 RepID=A0A6N8IPV6_9BURK|nr:DUF202 domain-containing protein [Ramlibacter sp. CGMCC 1.13660]MVQ28752.1 DUF202 domain-containing protein [Ramlibacter pinisoli]
MSFQRTRMSADRTLMSVIRTAISLIGFGFTIYQVFEKLEAAGMVDDANASRNFGLAFVLVALVMLLIGIVYHVAFMLGLRRTREQMTAEGLIHGESVFPPSFTLVTAALVFLLGLVAITTMLGFATFG